MKNLRIAVASLTQPTPAEPQPPAANIRAHSVEMRSMLALRLVLLLACAGPALAGSPHCRAPDPGAALPQRQLFVVAGQSNAAGLASVHDHVAGARNLAWAHMRVPGVQIYGIFGAPKGVAGKDDPVRSMGVRWSQFARWRTAQPGFGYKNLDDTRTWFAPKTRSTDLFGPELLLARSLAMRPPYEHYIVKLAVSNTTLFPTERADHWSPGGHLYQELMTLIADAHNSQRARADLKVAGLLFVQGESDALMQARAQRYATHLRQFITAFRQDLARMGCTDDPATPVALVELQDIPQWTDGRVMVRHAQRQIAQQLPRVTLIETDDLRPALRVQDGVHYDEYAQALLGLRAYRALVASPTRLRDTERTRPSR